MLQDEHHRAVEVRIHQGRGGQQQLPLQHRGAHGSIMPGRAGPTLAETDDRRRPRTHDHAAVCMIMLHGQRRDRRCVGLHGRRAAAAHRPAPRPRARLRDRRQPGRRRAAELYPSLAVAYPDLVFERSTRTGSPASTSCSSACPTRPRMALAPTLHGKVGCLVDLSAAFRLKDASLYPTWYGFEHDQPDAAGRGRLRAARAVPVRAEGRAADRHPRLLRDGGLAGPRAARAAGPDRAGRRDRRRRVRGDGAGRGAQALVAVRHGRRGLHGLRPPRPPPHARDRAGDRGPGPVHAPPGPDEPGHPRHLLRPAGRRAVTTDDLLAALAGSYAGEPFVAVRRAAPSTKATLGTNAVHLTARFDDRTGTVVVLVRHRQPDEGRVGRRAPVRQRRARAWPRPRASRRSGCCRERRAGVGRRGQGRRPRRGAALHPPLLGQRRGGQVRRQRARPAGARPTRWSCSRRTSC